MWCSQVIPRKKQKVAAQVLEPLQSTAAQSDSNGNSDSEDAEEEEDIVEESVNVEEEEEGPTDIIADTYQEEHEEEESECVDDNGTLQTGSNNEAAECEGKTVSQFYFIVRFSKLNSTANITKKKVSARKGPALNRGTINTLQYRSN